VLEAGAIEGDAFARETGGGGGDRSGVSESSGDRSDGTEEERKGD
jgi:hypothetical protein